MKSIQHCSNSELNLRLMNLVQREREMLAMIILHIQEINRRKVFLEMGYPSMFSYMTEHLKYSPGSAMRRLDAAKVVAQAPEILDQLQTGALNLSQVSMVEQSVRQMKKSTPQRSLTSSEKAELLKKLSGKTKAQSEVLIAQTLGFEPVVEMKTEKHQADESVTMTLTFSKQEWAELQQMRELLSNATGGNLKETLVHVARKVIQQKTVVKNKKSIDSVAQKMASDLSRYQAANHKNSAAESGVACGRTPIASSARKIIQNKHQGCQYKDSQNGKLCGSKLFPTIEHLQPVWAGGGNELENLTILCSAHNTFRYRQQAGIS